MGDNRFPTALQIVLIVAANGSAGIRTTSSLLADGLNTNPSFVRKIVASLAKAGVLASSEGVSGGIRLAQPATAITLQTIHTAILPSFKVWETRANLPPLDLVSRNIDAFADELGKRADEAIARSLANVTVQACLEQIAELEGERPWKAAVSVEVQ